MTRNYGRSQLSLSDSDQGIYPNHLKKTVLPFLPNTLKPLIYVVSYIERPYCKLNTLLCVFILYIRSLLFPYSQSNETSGLNDLIVKPFVQLSYQT